MPSFDTTRRVPFSSRQMFDLVADVQHYPLFLPLCEGLRVLSREQRGDQEVVVASMDVGYKAIRETFTSRVTLDHKALTVQADLVDGPFRHMQNRWSFADTADGCDVKFHITYEFKSMMLQMLMGAVFDQAFRKFAEAFESRARIVYGTQSGRIAPTA